MKKTALFMLIVLMLCLLSTPAVAGTRDDCITKCKQAVQFIQTQGIDTAIKEIGNKNGRFVWNNGLNYVFLMTMESQMLAHPMKPELTKAKNLIETRDVNGKAFNVDMINKAQKGKGWTKYVWQVPGMDVNKPKYTFIYRVPDSDYFVAAGFYVLEPGVFH